MTIQAPAAAARPSPIYLLTLALGCLALPCLGIGLGGALIGQSGGDPVRAMDVDGLVMFIAGFGILFAMRLIFVPGAPAGLRNLVRSAITIVLLLCIPLTLLALILALRLPATLAHKSLPVYFSILALLCQPLAITWLVKYRREGAPHYP